MFGSSAKGANAYAQIGVETDVSSASPHKLVVLLFDGALACLTKAAVHMKNSDVVEKGKSINHAIMIIDSGLRASLNKKAGGEIAQSLDDLYAYMGHRLLVANLRNEPEILTEVQGLLNDLRGSWAAISPDNILPAPVMPAGVMRASTVSGMYSNNMVAA